MVACMAVMAREAWTDERLDDLKENVNQRFDAVDKRFDAVDKRFDKIEAEMKAGFAEVNGRFDAIHGRIDSMQRTMIVCFSGMTASIVGAILVTQL
jgi:tetrahydromethanopterin S-methyltransferase subunit G